MGGVTAERMARLCGRVTSTRRFTTALSKPYQGSAAPTTWFWSASNESRVSVAGMPRAGPPRCQGRAI